MNEQILQLAEQGLKRSEIAKRLSVPKMVVLAVLCKAPSYHKMSDEDLRIDREIEFEERNARIALEEKYQQLKRIAFDLFKAGSKPAMIAEYFNKQGETGFYNQKFTRRQVAAMLRHMKSEG